MTELDLWDNNFEVLPEDICHLEKLEILGLMYNNLKKLPDSICKLNNLKHLPLDYNQLTELPKDFGNLSNLVYLGLSNMKFNYLPNSVEKLNKLENIQVTVKDSRKYRRINLKYWIKINSKKNFKDKIESYFFYNWGLRLYLK